MSRSKDKNQAKLKEIYGIYFPDALFWLHDFLVEQRACEDPIDLNDLAFTPSGVLKILLEFDDLNLVEFTGDPLLHYRYYRDVPEFFTYLSGDSDGQHWGILLDEPNEGFRGVGMYWSNDGAEMTVYDGIFDALISECEDSIDSYEDYLLDEDEDEDDYYKEQIETYQKTIDRIEEFLEKHQLSRAEGRPIGLETSTGLDIVLNKSFGRDRKEAIEMLKVGRELWYWEGKDRTTEAYELMRKAYELLDRLELIHILDAHYRDRSLPNVDLVRHRAID
jgi:Uncharacterised conserved protein (DUF2228)